MGEYSRSVKIGIGLGLVLAASATCHPPKSHAESIPALPPVAEQPVEYAHAPETSAAQAAVAALALQLAIQT